MHEGSLLEIVDGLFEDYENRQEGLGLSHKEQMRLVRLVIERFEEHAQILEEERDLDEDFDEDFDAEPDEDELDALDDDDLD